MEEAFHEHAEFGGRGEEIGRNECSLVFVSGAAGRSLNVENDEIERILIIRETGDGARAGNSADPCVACFVGGPARR